MGDREEFFGIVSILVGNGETGFGVLSLHLSEGLTGSVLGEVFSIVISGSPQCWISACAGGLKTLMLDDRTAGRKSSSLGFFITHGWSSDSPSIAQPLSDMISRPGDVREGLRLDDGVRNIVEEAVVLEEEETIE